MMRCSISPILYLAVCAGLLPGIRVQTTGAAQPLHRAHAHNDYYHDRPLLDALDHGFAGVEADVFLVDGALLVGHARDELHPDETLEALYLKPLLAHVTRRGGRVYEDGSGVILLIDFKADGPDAYRALDDLLVDYASMLTTRVNDTVTEGPVTVVISGDRPWDLIAADETRYAGLDGRLANLEDALPTSLLPLISDRWTAHFTWTGEGDMPASERQRLEAIVTKAHEKGRKVRFWATPDAPGPEREAVWRVLHEAGVDLINTDDLAGLKAFLGKRQTGTPITPGGND